MPGHNTSSAVTLVAEGSCTTAKTSWCNGENASAWSNGGSPRPDKNSVCIASPSETLPSDGSIR
jgi:hypothetical protein